MRRSSWGRSSGSIRRTRPTRFSSSRAPSQIRATPGLGLLDNLRRALEDAALEKEAGAQSPHTFTLLNEFVAVVGRRLGEMHVALAADTNDPAFAPEVADDEVVSSWAKDAGNRSNAA